ncbi:DMT family transporter [Colwellia psychrerythraea]|uniref:EamA domain-containing protein n=1 Tax=Colwellia psychrerythraea TaxID=28229 RepID=A0A099K8E4_COLPS|nr:DMT family transporter [Colwellia psychrerythraea]KGJ86596.1 protein of unknown function DUF6 transmembrane [Colwellia psychrerythraea]
MHEISGRWRLGLFLSLTTAILWGVLPIALKGLLQYMDVNTITWYRFLIAAVFLGGYLIVTKRIPSLSPLKNNRIMVLMILTIAGLLANYISYMIGLEFTSPESTQVMIQIAPMLLLIGGVYLFKETFNAKQKMGLFTFFLGLLLFFNQRFEQLLNFQGDYALGLFFVVLAAILWAIYALAQKQLLKHFASEEIMVLIYIAGTLAFLPSSIPSLVLELDTVGWLLLLFCGANTLVAYGAFAEALEHWEASRVSATLAITPLLTLIFMQMTNYILPGAIDNEPLNTMSIIGAVILVIGSGVTALSKNRSKQAK